MAKSKNSNVKQVNKVVFENIDELNNLIKGHRRLLEAIGNL